MVFLSLYGIEASLHAFGLVFCDWGSLRGPPLVSLRCIFRRPRNEVRQKTRKIFCRADSEASKSLKNVKIRVHLSTQRFQTKGRAKNHEKQANLGAMLRTQKVSILELWHLLIFRPCLCFFSLGSASRSKNAGGGTRPWLAPLLP